MKRTDAETRRNEILYEIYRHKAMTTKQVRALYFDSFFRARNYLLALEKKGLLKRLFAVTETGSGRPEQVFFLTLAGIMILRGKGFKTGSGEPIHKYLIKPGEAQIRHDLKLTDIIISLYTNELIEEYTTELFLRQIRYSENKNYRIPDFVFKNKDGYGFVELEEKSRSGTRLFYDIKDYRTQYKDFKKIFVVRASRVNFYKEILNKTALNNFEIHTFESQKLIKKYPL